MAADIWLHRIDTIESVEGAGVLLCRSRSQAFCGIKFASTWNFTMTEKEEAIEILESATMGVFGRLSTATKDEIQAAEASLNCRMPDGLRDFYENYSNGLIFGRFKLLPILSGNNLKKTAESISRVNSSKFSHWFAGDEATINEFLIFCVESSDACFAFKRDGSVNVWQWAKGWPKVEELDFDFWAWLSESLRQEKHFLSK